LSRPSIDPTSDPLWFIADEGETGPLARSLDWAKSPLGPPQGWPQALKTTLGILFRSRHPMFLFWGPELIQFYNDAYRPSLGRGKHPAAMGQRGEECWPEIWATIGPQIRDVMEHAKASWNYNQLLPIFRNGRIEDVYWTYSYSPVLGDDGRVAGTLVICTETTQEVLTRQGIERARKEADLAREELHGIFMQAPLPMCILTGADHVFTLANEPYLQLVGREILGRPLRQVFTEAEAGYYVPILNQVYWTGEPVLVREAPLRLPGPDGVIHEQVIDVGYHPYRDSSGAPKGVLVVIHDVTLPVLARKQLEDLTTELKTAVRARDEFLSLASHELRTPLTGMKLYTQAARRSLEKNSSEAVQATRMSRLIEQTDHGLGRMIRLVEDMLDISRIQNGKLQLHLEDVDFARAVQETLERFGPQFAEAGIEVSLHAPTSLTARVDRFRVEQVLTNLITNAIRYAPGAPVEVRLAAEPSRITLSFQDNGPGIAERDQERVFERFERLTPGSNVSGLGLGLYIVREIVRAHGGSIRLHSEPGQGTRFIIELPVGESSP
jgi:signal transduction histidine kinase